MTKSVLVQRANTLCEQSNDQLGNLAHQTFGDNQPTDSQWRSFMSEKAIPLVEARLQGIRTLGTPTDGAAELDAILAAGDKAIATAKQNPQLMTPSSRAPFDDFDQLATAYGIASCSLGG